MKLVAKDITIIAMMIAIIEVCKIVLANVPNIELTSFFIIIFTLYMGKRILVVIPAFILIEGLMFGFSIWWVMYLYVWPILVLLTYIFRKMKSAVSFSILSGVFGLMFGFLCSWVYIFLDIKNGTSMAFAWWISGIPWDIVHGIGNFFIMLVLYHPVTHVMKKLRMEKM